jgi:holo-[acyl-carrier protein] synthase
VNDPVASGLGIDAVDLDRFRASLERRPSLVARLFTEGERRDAGSGAQRLAALAARFAAKEATMKAFGIGLGDCAFTDIAVIRSSAGAPTLALSGRAAARHAALGGGALVVSLTHTSTVAMAVVQVDGVAR